LLFALIEKSDASSSLELDKPKFSGIFLPVDKERNTILTEEKYIWRKIAAGLSGLIMIFLIWQVFAMKAEIAEIKEATDKAQEATGYIVDFGTDLNEIRELLLLPTENYTLSDEEASVEEGDTVIEDMFKYINQLGVSRTIEQNTRVLDEYFSTYSVIDLLKEKGLVQVEGTYDIQDAQGRTLISVSISDEDGSYSVTNYFGEEIETDTGITLALNNEIESIGDLIVLVDDFEAIKNELETLLYVEGTTYDTLTAKGMWAEAAYDAGDQFEYYLVNHDQIRLADLKLSKDIEGRITWTNLVTGETTAPITLDDETIAALIEPLDSSTFLEQKITENREKLESLVRDAAFLKALEDNQVTMSEVREDDNGIYYDLADVEGTVLSTIYIDKHTGKVMVTNGEDNLELMSATQEAESKKKLWICLMRFRSTMS